MQRIRFRFIAQWTLVCILVLAQLCPVPLPSAAATNLQVIVLKDQETLHSVARKYLGDADRWTELRRWNRRLVRRLRRDPDRPIRVGTRVRLPADAIVRSVPSPHPSPSSGFQRAAASPVPAPSSPAPPVSQPGDPSLREREFESTGLVDVRRFPKGKLAVAILPFQTPGTDPELDQFGVGTMDNLITSLKNVPHFIVIDRGRIERIIKEQAFQQTGLVDPASTVKVGKVLGAQSLISGSIQATGEKIRIVATFVDIKTGQVNESHKVTGILDEIFDLQDQLANLFIKVQKVQITSQQQQRVDKVLKSTKNLAAYQQYLKGRKAYLLFTPEGYGEAVTWYQKAIEADPQYAVAYAALSETWSKWGHYKEQVGESAQQEYEQAFNSSSKAIQINPDLPEAQRSFGLASSVLGKPGREQALRKAIEINPNDAETWLDLWRATGNSQDPDHLYLRKALDLDPDLLAARNDRGAALLAQDRTEEAIQEFRAALKINPENDLARINLGSALADLEQYGEAVPAFQEVLKRNPKNFPALIALGDALYFQDQYEQAVVTFQQALQVNPNHSDTHTNLAVALADLKRYEEAIASYREALRLDPQNATAHAGLGAVLYALKRFEEAISENREAVRLNPNSTAAHTNLGVALAALKRFDEAIVEYQQVLQMRPNHALGYYNLACTYALQGQKQQALDTLKKAFALQPDLTEPAQQDDDLISLREDEQFKKIVGK